MENEIDKLKKRIMALCAQVEEQLWQAVRSIKEQNGDLARQIIDHDTIIDEEEVDIEEECLKILALHQPVAIDLRFIITVLKINNDLERIGDLAVNIAERAVFLAEQPKIKISIDLLEMAQNAQSMLRRSLDALVHRNPEIAYQVCASDDAVDQMNRQMYLKVQTAIQQNPEQISALIQLLSASRHLERIADHATNIAEDVIYMIEGQIVRHKNKAYQ
jgi:phosphate transport system protein